MGLATQGGWLVFLASSGRPEGPHSLFFQPLSAPGMARAELASWKSCSSSVKRTFTSNAYVLTVSSHAVPRGCWQWRDKADPYYSEITKPGSYSF